VTVSVAYRAVLPARLDTVVFVSRLLSGERRRRGTRAGTRRLGCFTQAVLILRWFLDGTRPSQLATDNTISKSTAYDYLHEGIDVLSEQAPSLSGALLAAKMAGHSHVIIDGTLIETDRCRLPGPTPGVDLFWSGEHDTTALRYHAEILPLLKTWTGEDTRTVLGDLGYEGEADTITVAFKKPRSGELTDEQRTHNRAHNGRRAIGERGNSLLKMTFKALRNISVDPWEIGDIVRAALVLLHVEHGRTT
jgi:hypothetical protein